MEKQSFWKLHQVNFTIKNRTLLPEIIACKLQDQDQKINILRHMQEIRGSGRKLEDETET